MTDIDRRTLFAVAGSGLILASCGNEKQSQISHDGQGYPAGYCDKYGDLVSKEAPGIKKASDFVPENICVVFIILESDGIKVRHAYWRAETDIAVQAKRLMIEVFTGRYSVLPKRAEQNFHRFGFNSKTKIYFFINNEPDEFGFIPGGVDRKIRFAPISANEHVTKRMEENYAFYNMQPIDFKVVSPAVGWPFPRNHLGYSLDFWNLDKGGRSIQGINPNDFQSYYLYSMNIHLLQRKKELPSEISVPTPSNAPTGTPIQDYLPLILDPDTGNMGGEP